MAELMPDVPETEPDLPLAPDTGRTMLPELRDRLRDILFSPRLNGENSATFAIVEGAQSPDLLGMLLGHGVQLTENNEELPGQIKEARTSGKPAFCTLPLGYMADERPLDCPYIIELHPDNALTDWLLNEGWARGWGIYAALDQKAMAARQALDYIPDPGPGLQTHDAFTGIAYDNEVDTPMVHRLARQLRRFGRVQLESSGKTVYFRFFDPAVLNTYLPTCTDAELQRFFGPLTAIYAENYSEEPSLNKPHLFHRYAITKSETGGFDLDHQECDLVDQKAHRPARHPAHDLRNADPGIKVPPTPMIPLIRHAQEKVFEEVEWVKFREKIRPYLKATYPTRYSTDDIEKYSTEMNLIVAKAREFNFPSFTESLVLAELVGELGWECLNASGCIKTLQTETDIIRASNILTLASLR